MKLNGWEINVVKSSIENVMGKGKSRFEWCVAGEYNFTPQEIEAIRQQSENESLYNEDRYILKNILQLQ